MEEANFFEPDRRRRKMERERENGERTTKRSLTANKRGLCDVLSLSLLVTLVIPLITLTRVLNLRSANHLGPGLLPARNLCGSCYASSHACALHELHCLHSHALTPKHALSRMVCADFPVPMEPGPGGVW